jgi:hypothetical protein
MEALSAVSPRAKEEEEKVADIRSKEKERVARCQHVEEKEPIVGACKEGGSNGRERMPAVSVDFFRLRI